MTNKGDNMYHHEHMQFVTAAVAAWKAAEEAHQECEDAISALNRADSKLISAYSHAKLASEEAWRARP